jgi:ribose transport system permease protein
MRWFERVALLLVWLALIAAFGAVMPQSFLSWGNFSIMFVAVYFLGTGITGLSMLGIPLWVTNVFNGGALILAVTISQLTRGREASDIG